MDGGEATASLTYYCMSIRVSHPVHSIHSPQIAGPHSSGGVRPRGRGTRAISTGGIHWPRLILGGHGSGCATYGPQLNWGTRSYERKKEGPPRTGLPALGFLGFLGFPTPPRGEC